MADEHATPNDLERGLAPELVAIRRVRASLREVDGALAEAERCLEGPSAVSREATARAAARACGELGDVAHDVRRALLGVYGLYPW
jgi:hypothetical protein